MSTKALRHSTATRSAPKAGTKLGARGVEVSALGMPGRLAKLKAADMPWLSKKGLKALADVTEVSGPPTYKKPADWR